MPPEVSPLDSTGPRPSRSTLVHGNDEIGVSALATGIALRLYGRFRWIDCARPAPDEDLPAHWIFARGSARPEPVEIDRATLQSSPMPESAFHQLVLPRGPEEERRLASFLALPELFQQLGARDLDTDEPAAILLANVDSLASGPSAIRLEDRVLHERLHGAGISLFATAGATPPARMLEPFDRIYHLDVPPGVSWSHGVVVVAKDPDLDWRTRPTPIRDLWREMLLDPSLLPPF